MKNQNYKELEIKFQNCKGYYAGIGSREVLDDNILPLMTEIAELLRHKKYVLRSGNAIGSDQAFEKGAMLSDRDCYAEIFLPRVKKSCPYGIYLEDLKPFENLVKIGCKHYNKIESEYARNCHLRNVCQIIGSDIDNPIKVDFVLAWTMNGDVIGGTATALNLAEYLDIPIFNFGCYGNDYKLAKKECLKFLLKHVK